MIDIKFNLPEDIEAESMKIIEEELKKLDGGTNINPVVKRVIHATADFDFAKTLMFSENAYEKAIEILKCGAVIVADTNMIRAGINKKALEKLNCSVKCFMSDEDVASKAKLLGVTRAAISMEKAAAIEGHVVFAIGNAPTALIKLHELMEENKITPSLIIGVPVGFVNVVESKELILNQNKVPYIVSQGRKGGSTVAVSICNALMYEAIRQLKL
ncbi:MAG: precorrin-8X methylmutase [Oscillospiraceae bacterium]